MTMCPCPSYRVYKVIILYVNQDSHPCPSSQNQSPLSLPYRQMGSRACGSFAHPCSLLWLTGSGGAVREKELGRVFLVQADIFCCFPAGGREILVGGVGQDPVPIC